MIEEYQLKTLRDHVSSAFCAGMPQFPHYTLHGKEHLNELDRLCHLICSSIPNLKDDIEKINRLRLAIILHDYAMVDVPSPEREQELREQMGPTLSFADIVRKTHQDEIIQSLQKRAEELYTIFTDTSQADFEASIAIARHHRFHPLDQAPDHLRGLCALMRLLDELDIGPARAPRSAYSSLRERMDKVSKLHWLKHIHCTKIEKGTTFFLNTVNHKITLVFWVAVMATENTWQIIQQKTVSKLQNCILHEGVKDIIRDEFNVNLEIKSMPEKPALCGKAIFLTKELEVDLAEVFGSQCYIVESNSTHNETETMQESKTVINENAVPVNISERQLIIHAIPSENLFNHLGRAGRLSVFGNEYIQRNEINVGGKPGAINRIYLGPADCGKTRSAAEWIHNLTSTHPSNWTVLRTEPGNVPINIDDNIILDASMYGGAHEMPQNAILFLDDLPANLPPNSTEFDASDAIRRLFTWFKNYPHFHNRRLVGTIRNEDLHSRLDWPEVLPTLETELELLRLEEFNQHDYEHLWRGMSRGTIIISHNEGENNFHLSLSDDFVDQVARQATNPEGVAKFVFDAVRNDQSQLSENDSERFHANAVQTWLNNTWPAMRENYGTAARVFHTIARFLEAGLRINSGFKGNLEPLWKFHAAFGPALCKKESDDECNYLEVIDNIGSDGHAIGKRDEWIRPRWDYLLQTDRLPEVEIVLPDAGWFELHSRNLSILRRKQIAMHLTAAKLDLKDMQYFEASWPLGVALGKNLLALLEENRINMEGFQNEELYIYNEIVTRFGADEAPAQREQVAKALGNKGVILVKQDRSEEAIAAYDDLVNRFGEDQTPELREQVAKALFNKGVTLGKLDRSEEEIAAYDDLVNRFGEDQTPELREQVAKALVTKGVTLGKLDRSEEAIAAFDDLVNRFGEDQTPELREQVAKALGNKGVTLVQLDRSEEAIAAFDDLVNRFGEDQTPELREQVAKALFNKGVTLVQLDRSEEAIAAYDDLVNRFGEDQTPELREQVAKALVTKGVTLGQLDRREEEIAAYDDLVNRFGEDQTPELREQVAKALFNKGVTLVQLDRSEEAIAAYDDLVNRFGEDQTPELREMVANALVNKGVTLGKLDRREEKIAAYDDVVNRFGEDKTPELRELVAKALVNKGVTLGKLDRREEAIAAYDDLVNRFGEDQTPELREQVAKALFNKGVTLVQLDRSEEAIAAYDDLVNRFGEDKTPELREMVAKALGNKGVTLGKLDRREEAIAAFDDLVNRFGEDQTPELREQVAKAFNNKTNVAIQIWRKTKEDQWLKEAIAAGHKAHSMGASCYNLACTMALAGETDEAFHLLEQALENKQIEWTHVHGDVEQLGDPDWDNFRQHARYLHLQKQFGKTEENKFC